MTRYLVRHETTYEYGETVVSSFSEARLQPRKMARQHVIDTRLTIDPAPDDVRQRRDYFGNGVSFFELKRPHRQLRVTAISCVEVTDGPTPDGKRSEEWGRVTSSVRTRLSDPFLDAAQYVYDSSCVRRSQDLASYALESFTPGRPILDAVVELNHRVFSDFEYDPEATTVATPLEEAMARRRGVCQDFAHVMIGALRSIGIAARYVSGYVGAGAEVAGDDLVGAHASHAWVSVFCNGLGWVDVDPTNDLIVGDQHVVIGWGRDYEDVTPLKGLALGGGRHAVSVRVSVSPEPTGAGCTGG